MTLPAAEGTKRPQTPVRVPGVASTAIYGLVSAAGTQATVLGTSAHAVWLLVDDRVLVISTSDSTRLPNGVQIAAGSSSDLFRMVHHGATIDIGHGRIMLEGVAVTINRWWDPRPTLTATTEADLATAINGLPTDVPDIDPAPLRAALMANSAGGILHSARLLLGKGSGLTPEGDDYLAGALAGTRLLGEALRRDRTAALIAGVSVPLAKLADARTTSFSASLIHAALRGQVAEPAGALLRAFTGRGDIASSHESLLHVGHSSGPALAAGMVMAAHALIESASGA
ncbi:MAG: DUF2877 domain-containing protein [bacterium]|nr:DUF2877 domain-containing protein [bacterium]MCP4968414.1 DUF2877 domain-containing protein [bacterium]